LKVGAQLIRPEDANNGSATNPQERQGIAAAVRSTLAMTCRLSDRFADDLPLAAWS
jgi:hypothetical protein